MSIVVCARVGCDNEVKGRNAKKYCSHYCYSIAKTHAPLKCLRCDKPVGGRGKYCSQECYHAVPIVDGKHQCKDCKEWFTEDELVAYKTRTGEGYQNWCKGCKKIYYQKWHGENYDKQAAREKHLRKKFDISLEEYDLMFEKQGGMCALRLPSCETGTTLHVDHNHITGEIRGLLCFKCNNGIGMLGDNLEGLQAAVLYLMGGK